ncbi:MAG: transposase [Crocosphaera sp.]|nr:transposase [Crocosphaera sp.]
MSYTEAMTQPLTVKCKLKVPINFRQFVDETLNSFADACNQILAVAKAENCWNTTKLHHKVYKPTKESTGLKANHVCQAIRRVINNAKAVKQIHKFRPTSISLDARTFEYKEVTQQVGVTLKSGRVKFDLSIGGYQIGLLKGQKPTSATLSKTRKGDYYINIVVEIPEQPKGKTPKVIGVDLGLRDIASTSTGKSWDGSQLRKTRDRYVRTRASIQSKRTKGAKRLLKRLSGREKRFQKWINHNISKQLVKEAEQLNTNIAFEDLTGIRLRTKRRATSARFPRQRNARVRKKTRTEINRWAFYQLRMFTQYKAQIAGINVILVDPRYTSQTCSRCHHIHPVPGKSYREGKVFKCGNCGFEHDSDINGALNIAQLGGVFVSHPESSVYACDLKGQLSLFPSGMV